MKHQRGATLLEAMLASFILAIGALALTQTQAKAQILTSQSMHVTELTRVAESTFDQLRAGAVNATNFSQLASTATSLSGNESVGNITFNKTVSFADPSTGASLTVADTTPLVRANLSVTWTHQNESHTVQFTTLIVNTRT